LRVGTCVCFRRLYKIHSGSLEAVSSFLGRLLSLLPANM